MKTQVRPIQVDFQWVGSRSIAVGFVISALTACSPALVVQDGKLVQNAGLQCRQTATTGSHMLRRVCTTRAEREAQSAEAEEGLARAQEYQRAQAMMDRAERREIPRQ